MLSSQPVSFLGLEFVYGVQEAEGIQGRSHAQPDNAHLCHGAYAETLSLSINYIAGLRAARRAMVSAEFFPCVTSLRALRPNGVL